MVRLYNIVTGEWKRIFHDEGVVLILVGALVLYSALYGAIYGPQVVRDMPIAVVDRDMTPKSRELSFAVDATPAAKVTYRVPTLEQAKALFMEGKVVGVLLIDNGYEAHTLSGSQAHVSVYADGSYFLLYSGFLGAVADVVVSEGAQIEMQNLMASGVDEHTARGVALPVKYKIEKLYNPYNGYATALLPAVLIVILQQVLLIGIGMGMGTDSEFKRWGRYDGSSALAITLGKAIAYFLLYVPLAGYLLWANYRFFGYPIRGSDMDVILFLVPYMLAVIFLGITLGGLLHKRESSILYLAVFSVFMIMVSGISWPRQGMPDWLYYGGQLIPSSSAINGFVRLRTAGVDLWAVSAQWIELWVLSFVFAVTAVLSVARARGRK